MKLMEDGQNTIAVLEAMASGLPIVVTDSGAYSEIVGPENLLVEQGSSLQLYDSLKALINDPKRIRLIGRSNRKKAEKDFDGKKQCSLYAKELMSVLDK
jgi:glycosyltransferase involved in cell wall biosynthesis